MANIATTSNFPASFYGQQHPPLGAIIEGYRDLAAGRIVEVDGDLKAALTEAKQKERDGWK